MTTIQERLRACARGADDNDCDLMREAASALEEREARIKDVEHGLRVALRIASGIRECDLTMDDEDQLRSCRRTLSARDGAK